MVFASAETIFYPLTFEIHLPQKTLNRRRIMDYQVIQKAKPKEMKVKPNNTLADFFTQFIIIYEVAE